MRLQAAEEKKEKKELESSPELMVVRETRDGNKAALSDRGDKTKKPSSNRSTRSKKSRVN